MTTRLAILAILVGTLTSASRAEETSEFDAKVLPILKQRCFECHSHAAKIRGGLALDSRSGWQKGGANSQQTGA